MRVFRNDLGISQKNDGRLPSGEFILDGNPVSGEIYLQNVNTGVKIIPDLHFSKIFDKDGVGFDTYTECIDYLGTVINFKKGGGGEFSDIFIIADGNINLMDDGNWKYSASATSLNIEYMSGGVWNHFMNLSYLGDDSALNLFKELHIGTPDSPKELVVGEGDTYPVPLAFHFDGISTYEDVTQILKSEDGSTTGFFGDTSVGATLMVMSPNSFGSVKLKIDTLGDADPDNILAEYLDNTGVWRQVNVMALDNDFPHSQKANNLFTCSSCFEHVHFDPTPIFTFPWAQKTININGADYTGFWARFRILTPIVSDALIEQIKLGTNSTQIKEDGLIYKTGKQRISTYYPIPIKQRSTVGATPTSTNIQWSDSIESIGVENTFSDNKIDSFNIEGFIPEGFDTSIPLRLRVRWYSLVDDGNVEATIKYSIIKLGDKINGTLPTTIISNILVVGVGEDFNWKEVIFPIDVSSLFAGDSFIIELSRNSLVGNVNDTLNGPVVLTSVGVLGVRWKL